VFSPDDGPLRANSEKENAVNNPGIAVVGIALRYPDASSPDELWRNVLAGRRAFRQLPPERMRAEDYYSADEEAPDRHYTRVAAVLEGFEFDRVKYRIGGSTFRSTDMTHWLALDTVTHALQDAGFPAAAGLPRSTTGVIIGNTLTGEFSRANLMRLRWPYVRRTVGAALREQGWDEPQLAAFLGQLEERYKSPFPPVNEDTLAGGLANTISGRVCNYYDLGGGGFTVDGACSSSLLATATGCEALTAGQLDVAIVGGVDLSIDPFEVIGFAKTGALSTSEMKVYDRDSNGFWPGEGCGILVLMRDEDAVRLGKRRYATIAGWGYSSDGKGGITRPEAAGHRLAINRAYERAGVGFETVGYVEGHGTGTAVGDETELTAFSEARRAADAGAPAVPIGTVKGNFGHTKAAAGVAGLIKAVMVVHQQVIPPATSHYVDHPVLTGEHPAVRVPDRAEQWPVGAAVRAAVSSMGFGGINAHVIVDQADPAPDAGLADTALGLVRSRQDAELLLLEAPGLAGLRAQADRLAGVVAKASYAELGDVAAALAGELSGGPFRAAIVARSPQEAQQRARKLVELLDAGARSVLDLSAGVFLGTVTAAPPRITFLFPGQGAGRRGDGGAIRRRFADVDALYGHLRLPADGDLVATAVAQPRIATGSVAALRVLSSLGIDAASALGHSLGELSALHWAGVLSEAAVLEAAAARGEIMSRASAGDGSMASIAAPAAEVEPLLAGLPAVIAGYNSPQQTVVSGPAPAVDQVCAAAEARGLAVARLNVSHAFHSPQVAPAAGEFRDYLDGLELTPAVGKVISTVTGQEVTAETDIRGLLARQIAEPVRFESAVTAAADQTDLFLEVGPGRALRGLAAETAPGIPALSVEADSESLAPLLRAVAAAYVLGAPVRTAELFRDRYVKPFPLDKEFLFLANPCESAPADDVVIGRATAVANETPAVAAPAPASPATAVSATDNGRDGSLELLRRLMAERAELPIEAVQDDTNPLDELHLSSITVIQIVTQAAREAGRESTLSSAAFATSTVAQLAGMIDALDETAGDADARPVISGAGSWVRAFAVDLVPAEVRRPAGPAGAGDWQVFAAAGSLLAAPLADSLRQARLGDGVLLCLPPRASEDDIPLMLDAARGVLSRAGEVRLVVVGGRKGAAGLAKTLHLEAPSVATTVVILPDELGPAAEAGLVSAVTGDVAATSGFSEVHYDAAGLRLVPVLTPQPRKAVGAGRQAGPQVLGETDVLLVTGGGKGITAECALALGRHTGARVAIVGRSDLATDEELSANLQRLRRAGVTSRYIRADVTSADQVRAAVSEITQTLGPVTAVLHGAGRNEPHALATLDETAFRRTVAPKTGGLQTVLDAVDEGGLKLLVAFGSIIGRAGLSGEADYATANDWLTDLVLRTQDRLPGCRCLSLEWSVWAGAGMGERLGVLDALIRDGIMPISVADGVDIFLELLSDPEAAGSLVVMGRAEGLPTITMEQRHLPLTRFIERPQVYYPGIELVVDADLSALTDPYLSDHNLDGDLLFPAVLGMEAMAQVGAALVGRADAPTLEDMEFLRPIVVPPDGKTTIRIAALADTPQTVDVVIRTADTGFRADHYRARLRYQDGQQPAAPLPALAAAAADGPATRVPVDPATELYGPVLFQGGRFRRLLGYRALEARGCVAEISNASGDVWFGDFMPPDLTLADPGTRDALMHSIQSCVPDATLLPVGLESLRLADPGRVRDLREVIFQARERSRINDTYVYDLDVYEPGGQLVEQWRGLRLQAVRKLDGTGPWLPVLLGPYLERNVEPMTGTGIRMAVVPVGTAAVALLQHDRSALALTGSSRGAGGTGDGLGLAAAADAPVSVSSSAAGIAFALAGGRLAGGAVELAAAVGQADELAMLLGAEGFALARRLADRGESLPVAVARVKGAVESLRVSGQVPGPLSEGAGTWPDGWAVLHSGDLTVASFATTLQQVDSPVVFTIAARKAA
jgi:enediyne polyketide synthase